MIGTILRLVFSFIFILLAIMGMNYLVYTHYASEGYNVQWDYVKGCETELHNLDNSTSWESCFIAGNAYVIKNYGSQANE